MSLTLSFFLLIYTIILVLCVIFALINVYHIIATASLTPISIFATAFVGFLIFLTIVATIALLSDVDWSKEIMVFGGVPTDTFSNDSEPL